MLSGDQYGLRLINAKLGTLAASGAVNVDARGFRNLTIITATGATATVSRVDSMAATGHTTGTENSFTVAQNTKTVTAVDWPYFRISSAGAGLRYALV